MVAVIRTGQSVRRIFRYNENKISTGHAVCLGAENYPADHDRLSASQKLNLLLTRLELNENVKRGSVHISLNFHPLEKDLDNDKLMEIARAYMSGIGFAQQPYLVYQHFDAAHPHIHIISVKVRNDGKRIDMQNIGRNQSETARARIEIDFNLIRAQGREKRMAYRVEPIRASAVNYGKMQSKKAISQVLDFVLESYHYKSLAQLNAVLNLYNVTADRGSEDSRVFKAGGLVYRILSPDGTPTGVPIKASDFHNRPTLQFLEKKFQQCTRLDQRQGLRVKNAIRSVFSCRRPTLDELSLALEKMGISMVRRIAQNGSLYGITYVDHVSKQVCNGSELGKEFSAAAIAKNCRNAKFDFLQRVGTWEEKFDPRFKTLLEIQDILVWKNLQSQGLHEIINGIFQREFPGSHLPSALLGKKKKRRRRKGLSNN